MYLARFLNRLFKKDGFILIDAYSKKYIIGANRIKDIHKCATFVRVNRQVNTFYK